MTRRKPGPPDPAILRDELDAIGAELLALRRRTTDLGREYVWLDAAALSVQDDPAQHVSTLDALQDARDSLDNLANSLAIATDASTLASRHLARITLRDQH